VKLGFAGGAWLLCGLLFFLATPAMQKRRQRKNNFSQRFPFSDGDLLRHQQKGWGDLSRSRRSAYRQLLQVMMLLILLIPRKMIFGENLRFAWVAGGGIEGCIVGTGIGLLGGSVPD
jgi:hypothetical protein